VVGWEVAEEMDAQLVVAALDRAVAARRPAPGWIHHSDQGVQYACRDYVSRLLAAGAGQHVRQRPAAGQRASGKF
jgi:putative transposase